MRNFQKKRVWRNIMESKPVLIVLGIIILIFAWNVLRFWNKMGETAKNEKMAEEKVAELQQKKEKLTADINSLQTDPGKERVFRENYGLAKEGEDLTIVVEDKNAPAPVQPSSGFFGWLKNLFK